MESEEHIEVNIVPAEELWEMKRQQQALERDLMARGELPPEAVLLVRPEALRGARIVWPQGSLQDPGAEPPSSEVPP